MKILSKIKKEAFCEVIERYKAEVIARNYERLKAIKATKRLHKSREFKSKIPLKNNTIDNTSFNSA